MIAILAQHSPDLDWVKITIQIGGFGILSWLVWQLFTRTLPDLLKQHAESIKQKDAEFAAALQGLQKTFADTLANQREEHSRQMEQMWQRIDQLIEVRQNRDEQIVKAVQDLKPRE